MENYYILKDGVLYHSGVKGQRWGIRRYQNYDGSLTEEGYRHYGYHGSLKVKKDFKAAKKKAIAANKEYYADRNNYKKKEAQEKALKKYMAARKEYMNNDELQKAESNAWADQRREYINSKSLGESIASGLLLGPAGLYQYNSMMAAGKSSKGEAALSSGALAYTVGIFGNAPASYIIGKNVRENY